MPPTTVIGFAHRGARAHAPDNTLRAFRTAMRLGATGIETDVWLTADDVPALHHGGRVRVGRRRVAIGSLPVDALPASVPTLAALYDECGVDLDLSLDLKDGRSARAVLAVAAIAGHNPTRLWLCGRGPQPLAWRALDDRVRLVCDTRSAHLTDGWAAYLSAVRAGGADAVNLRRRRWSADLVEQVHVAGLLAFGWDAQSTRRIRALVELGCDAVYSDHVDRMVAVLGVPAG
ncbi:MAG: glycerophosphodiester phosphodiesterase [Mycobacteriales bacterium]